MLRRFFRSSLSAVAARRLYDALITRSREPVFYRGFGVPDTIDGRFDLLALHAFAVMEALKSLGPAGGKVGTALASIIFAGFDDALRELGVSDMGLARRMKAMAGGFYGRLEAYRAAPSVPSLGDAIARNLYRGETAHTSEAQALAHYIVFARGALRAQADALLQGNADFGPLPELERLP